MVYSKTAINSNPQIGGTGVTNAGTTGTTGVFTVGVTGLTGNTAYSYAAYATNGQGTTYSSVGTFTTIASGFFTVHSGQMAAMTSREIKMVFKRQPIFMGSTAPAALAAAS